MYDTVIKAHFNNGPVDLYFNCEQMKKLNKKLDELSTKYLTNQCLEVKLTDSFSTERQLAAPVKFMCVLL
jgi:hypothetical protein